MNKKLNKVVSIFSLVFSLLVWNLTFFTIRPSKIYAATFTSSSATLSDPRPSTSATYTFNFSNVTTSTIKCIRLTFATTASGVTTVPTGISTTAVALGTTSTFIPNPSGWGVTNTTNGTVLLIYATGTAPSSASSRTIALTGILNGSVADTAYFARVNTYNNTDCVSSAVDDGVGTFIYTNGQAVSLTVDPSISFTVNAVGVGGTVNSTPSTVASTSTTIPFGTVTTSTNGVAAHDLTVSTNAGSGYTIYTRYSGTLTSGTGSTIPDFSGTNASPATFTAAGAASTFGYTTEDASLAGGTASRFTSSKYAAFTTTNAPVVDSSTPATSQTTRIGYQVSIAGAQPAGTYTTTVILTAVPQY